MNEPMPATYDNQMTREPEQGDDCPCGNPAMPGGTVCRVCRAEIRAEQRGDRI